METKMSEDGEIRYFDINIILFALHELLEKYNKVTSYREISYGLNKKRIEELQRVIKKVVKWKNDYKNNVVNLSEGAG